MGRFRLLDANHDWQFGAGKESYAKDLPALLLDLETRILSWVGDAFFDLDAGVDWINLLEYNTQKQLGSSIKNIAFRTNGVTKVNDFSISLDNTRTADVELNVDTIFGSNIQNFINLSIGG